MDEAGCALCVRNSRKTFHAKAVHSAGPPGTRPRRRAEALLTCGGPGLDVPRAVDHGVLRFPFLHGAQAVPAGRSSVRPLGMGGGLLCT